MVQEILRETMIGAFVVFPNCFWVVSQWGNRSYSSYGDDFRQGLFIFERKGRKKWHIDETDFNRFLFINPFDPACRQTGLWPKTKLFPKLFRLLDRLFAIVGQ